MATTLLPDTPRLAPAVRTVLHGLRRRIRRYVWLEGLGAAIAWLGAAFWLSLAIDWFFEPPPGFRVAVLAAVAGVLAVILVQFIGRRAFVPLTDSNMATVLERRFPQLDDSLLTSVVLVGRQPDQAGYSPQMLAHTCREAAGRIVDVRLPGVFNPVPLRRNIIAAVLLAAGVAVFGLSLPGPMEIWARRNLLLQSDVQWPRKIHLRAVGFDDTGAIKVASGDDVNVVVQALPGDTEEPVVPASVEIRYRIEGGERGRKPMVRVGGASPDSQVLQEYSHTFRGVLSPVRFDVAGGDAQLRDLRIEVVPNPALEMELEEELPAYMERPKRTRPVTGAMQVPLGTRITVHGRSNKELDRVRIEFSGEDRQGPLVRTLEAKDLAADRRGFDCRLEPLTRDTTLLVTLFDTDRIKSREPVRLALVAVPDEAPQVAVRLVGIGSAITAQARLPVLGRVTDDYGLDKIWFEYDVNKQKPGRVELSAPPRHPVEAPIDGAALEARDLKLAPGQKLSLALKAADLCTLGKGPNIGSSENWVLDVVSPAELRAMLEARELVLRQRFEAIIQEVTESRDGLLRMEFPTGDGKAPPDKKADDGHGPPYPFAAAEEKKPGPANGSEPGDEPGEKQRILDPAEQLSRRTERIQSLLLNCRKNAQETLGVAEGFDDIRQQLVNNRIDTEELKERLGAGIAEPLHKIVQEMFPDLERRLDVLLAGVADAKLAPQRRDAAHRQADEVLLAMRKVLAHMVELEDFNKLVERLRTIIKVEEQITDQTKQRHKQKIRDLLEDK